MCNISVQHSSIMFPIVIFLYLLRLCQCQEVKFVLNIDSQLECCDEASEAFVDCSATTVGRYNETTAYMFGTMKVLQDIGPDVMMEIILMKEASGGKYELMFQHELCDLCDEFRLAADSAYHSYFKYFDLPEECPFTAGDYLIKDFIVDTDDYPINSNTAGRYQAIINVYYNPEKDCKTTKEFLYCLTMKLIIEVDEE